MLVQKDFDVPRVINPLNPALSTNTAIIGDPRNNENLIVSQFHHAMLKFHNEVVDALVAVNFAGDILRRGEEDRDAPLSMGGGQGLSRPDLRPARGQRRAGQRQRGDQQRVQHAGGILGRRPIASATARSATDIG